MAGVGATAAYLFKLCDIAGPIPLTGMALGSSVVCLYFLVLSGLLITKCLQIDEIQVPTNEPDNLYQPRYDLLAIREAELKNVQERINKAAARNLKTANWLNKIRLLTLVSPIIPIIIIVVVSAFCP